MNAASIDFGPGVVAVLTPIATALAAWLGTRRVSSEFKNNSGSTLRDAVDRIETGITDLAARVDRLESQGGVDG